jgi:hypothetical protein
MNATGEVSLGIPKFQGLPKPGQILLYVDFSAVKHKSFSEAYRLLEELGYQPRLQYSENEDGTINLYALLKDESLDGKERDYLSDEWERLAEAFLPDDMAVRSPRSVPTKQAV